MYNHLVTTVDNGVFSVVDVPGKGKGVRAMRPIAPGEEVLAETPLFMKPLNANYHTIVSALSTLSDADRRGFLNLDNRYRGCERTVLGIFKTNALPCGDDSSVQDDAEGRAALLILGSRFNHSCCPNITTYFSEGSRKFIFRTLKDIARGEEMCLSYKCTLLAPRDARQAYLQAAYQFTCMCEACSMSGMELKESDGCRLEVNRLYQMEIMNNQLMLAYRLERVKRALDLLRMEGILEVYEAIFSDQAFVFCILVSDTFHAKMWIQKAWAAQYKLTGLDSYPAKIMGHLINDPTSDHNYGHMEDQTLFGPD